jgi:hypothetical protein
MSYSPTANKVYTFTATNPSEVCSHVNAVKGVCYAAWRSTCGNGIVEPGEDCDDTTGCCDLTTCQLATAKGASCSPAIDAACCRYLPPYIHTTLVCPRVCSFPCVHCETHLPTASGVSACS